MLLATVVLSLLLITVCIFQILQSNSLQIGFPPVPYLYNNTDEPFSSALPPRDSALPMVSQIILPYHHIIRVTHHS